MLGDLARLSRESEGGMVNHASRGYSAVRLDNRWYSDSSTEPILDSRSRSRARVPRALEAIVKRSELPWVDRQSSRDQPVGEPGVLRQQGTV